MLSGVKNLKNALRLSRYRKISTVLLFGLLVRLILAISTIDPFDFEVWYIASTDMLSGLISPYHTMYYSYPPIWAYIQFPFTSLLSVFANPFEMIYYGFQQNGQIIAVTHPIFNLLTKFPIIIGDILIGIIIFEFISNRKNEDVAKRAFALWFLNPLVIWIGSAMGQIDVLVSLMSLLAFIFFIKEKFFLCGFSIGLGAMIKIYPIFLVPLYFIFAIKSEFEDHHENGKRFLKKVLGVLALFTAGVIAALALSVLPLLIDNSIPHLFEAVFTRGGYIISIGGLSITNIIYLVDGEQVFYWLNDYGRAQMINFVTLMILVISITAISAYYSINSKKSFRFQKILRANIIAIICIFLTSLVVNSQYILWIIPFLVISFGLYGNYRFRLMSLSICAVVFSICWVFPFYPLIFYSDFTNLAIRLEELHLFFINGLGFQIMVLSGLIAGFIIISLIFPRVNISFKSLIAHWWKKTRNKTPEGGNHENI